LIPTLDELTALNVVSLDERIDGDARRKPTVAHPRRDCRVRATRIAERVKDGIERARRQGRRLGRPERQIAESVIATVWGLSVREAAKRLAVSTATAHRWLQKASRKSSSESPLQIA
jgi:DNA-directed RNA polymerase specialized sigma24 family protein